jgi:hypothetical protein
MIKPLQQCLFGYRNGHRRLASSTELPVSDERLLLRLTDLSGPRLIPGFETYISGYRLPSRTFYALAKTWYAPELERPGCVWTHVLLVPVADFKDLNATAADRFLELFRRPSVDTPGISGFDSPLDQSKPASPRLVLASLPVREMVEGLYTSGKPVVVPSSSSEFYDVVALRLWGQQPSSLRQDFTFCTGSLDLLRWETEVFNLQIMPERVARQHQAELFTVDGSFEPKEKWSDCIARDIIAGDNSRFRDFIGSYFESAKQSDFSRNAKQLTTLAKAFVAVQSFQNDTHDVASLVDIIGDLYPRPEMGRRLKQALFGSNSIIELQPADLAILLRCLAVGNTSKAYSIPDIALSDRARKLWQLDAAAGYDLLVYALSIEKTPALQELITGIFDVVTIEQLEQFKPLSPGLLIDLGEYRPELLSERGFWDLTSDSELALEIAEALADRLSLNLVFQNLSKARRYDLLVRIFRAKGTTGVPSLLAVLATLDTNQQSDRQALTEELRPFTSALSTFVRDAGIPGGLLYAVGELLSPSDDVVLKSTTVEDWCLLLDGLTESTRPCRAHAFAFVLALNNFSGKGYELVKRTFDLLHKAAARSDLAFESWSLIRDHLPRLSWHNKWDKCERLRRAVIRAYITHNWPLFSFFEITSDDDTLEDLLKSCEETEEGGRILSHVNQLDLSPLPSNRRRLVLQRSQKKRY